MAYVDLREETPPEGEKPLHWRLPTTLDVETVADALDVAARYARRWKIEEPLRIVKRKGVDIEGLRIRDTEPRNRLVPACFVAATVAMQMAAGRDGPLLETVSRDLEGATARQKNPHPAGSPAFATWVCARLGGWTGYHGKPGPIAILRRWTEFQSPKHGAAPEQKMTPGGDQDV